ncbi:MAG: hypothetical protein PHY30_00035 [Candidatus Pacebacteria bacterium]|nr:hypothetical protein [Candidatus Paceibacterota bacterium]
MMAFKAQNNIEEFWNKNEIGIELLTISFLGVDSRGISSMVIDFLMNRENGKYEGEEICQLLIKIPNDPLQTYDDFKEIAKTIKEFIKEQTEEQFEGNNINCFNRIEISNSEHNEEILNYENMFVNSHSEPIKCDNGKDEKEFKYIFNGKMFDLFISDTAFVIIKEADKHEEIKNILIKGLQKKYSLDNF